MGAFTTTRRVLATVLCALASSVAVILGLAAGLGAFVVVIVLMANGTIKVGTGILLLIFGLPALEFALSILSAVIGHTLGFLASLLDPDIVDAWAPPEDDFGF